MADLDARANRDWASHAVLEREWSQQLYSVTEDCADDPEFGGHWLLTAREIAARYPDLAPLFHGFGTESLTYVAELWRVRIEPHDEVEP